MDADRALLEHTVANRAQHPSEDDARDTWSFARAECLLGKEYRGRFLIELLQNAADAWRASHPSGTFLAISVLVM